MPLAARILLLFVRNQARKFHVSSRLNALFINDFSTSYLGRVYVNQCCQTSRFYSRNSSKMTISKKPLGRGAFIVLEGLDRSGKTTQAKLLVQALKHVDVPSEFMRFPDRSPNNSMGKLLTDYLENKETLDDHALHLLFTAQRAQEKNRMRKLLESGTTLVVDRYSYSGIAYSVAKGVDQQWCVNVESMLLQPDLVIYMDITPELAATRGDFGKERTETLSYQRDVYEAYRKIIQPTWKVLEAGESDVDELSEQIKGAALATLGKIDRENLPLLLQRDLIPTPTTNSVYSKSNIVTRDRRRFPCAEL